MGGKRTYLPGWTPVPSLLSNLAAASRPVQRAAAVAALRTEQLSRSDLIGRLGISSSSVTRVVRSLLDEGMIQEIGAVSSTLGRPPVQLQLNAQYGHLVAVSCEGEQLRTGLYDLHGVEIRANTITLGDQILDLAIITKSIDAVQRDAGVAGKRLLGIAFSVPGVVDTRTGVVSEAPDLRWKESVPLRALLEGIYGVPVTVDNDVNLMVMAEREQGGAVGADDVIYLYLGRSGVGAGIISGGRLTQGGHGAAGEIGIIPLCMAAGAAPGTRVEDSISVAAIGRALQAHGLDAAPAPIPALVRWAEAKNEDACRIRSDALDALAHSILILSAILDPTVVLIGGAARDLLDIDLIAMTERLVSQTPAPPALEFAHLDSGAVLQAAQMRCWRRILAGGI
jgi:predicted NBD/HSP70 family sugar kinase